MATAEIEENTEERKESKEQIDIAGPMFIWILLLVIALAIEVIAADTSLLKASGSLSASIVYVAKFILFMPGSIILPLIVGAVIGAEVGKRSKNMRTAIKAGLINGIYACIVYIIAILVIYEIIVYVLPSIVPSVLFLVSEWLAVPAAIVILLSLAFSILSHSRKVSV